MRERNRRWAQRLVAAGLVLISVGLLAGSQAVGEGIRRGLAVCGNVLIPALFPFMVLACFVSVTRYGDLISAPLRPVTTGLFKLPGELGAVILMSMVGGFPVGGRMVAALLEQKRINEATAQRMMCFCVNAGPPFLISAVGMGMFASRRAGVILLATQLTATLVVGAVTSARAKPVGGGGKGYRPLSGSSGFVVAVANATSAMIAMCAYAVLFSGVLSALAHSGVNGKIAGLLPVPETLVNAVLSGALEVTSGCLAAVQAGGGELSFGLVSLFVSFGGLSVIFQIMSCFQERPIRWGPFLLARLGHGALATSMAVPLYKKLCGEVAVWSAQSPPLATADRKNLLYCFCLLGMSTIFMLSLRGGGKKRDRKN